MFEKCSALNELNLLSFNTSKVTNMSYMFCNCSSLKEIDLSSFNTNLVNDMSYMFCNCSFLKKLNLSSFNTINETEISHIFYFINKSCKVQCKDKKILMLFKNETGCIII